jgi:ATP-binding cassette subfamily F protein uup
MVATHKANVNSQAASKNKSRKMSFKEVHELAGMEAHIHAVEAEICRIENLFASPDFHRTHAGQANQLMAELEAEKANLTKLFARWEELEALKAATETK